MTDVPRLNFYTKKFCKVLNFYTQKFCKVLNSYTQKMLMHFRISGSAKFWTFVHKLCQCTSVYQVLDFYTQTMKSFQNFCTQTMLMHFRIPSSAKLNIHYPDFCKRWLMTSQTFRSTSRGVNFLSWYLTDGFAM